MNKTSRIGFSCIVLAAAHAHAQLRVVSYNMLDKPANLTNTTVVNHVKTVFGSIAADNTNGIAKRPDVIFVSEQTAASPGNLATILNDLYGVSSYVAITPVSPASQGSTDRLAYVYDSAAVTLSSTPVALPIVSTYPRPTVRASFRPVGYDSPDADVYVYGMHLKASNTSADEVQRANQTLATRADSDALPAGSNIVYAGDFNVYTSNEQGYRNLFAAGNGQAADPINQSFLANGAPIAWNNNGAYAAVHTQSTRTTSIGDGGATGGVDDRFDFQLVSNGMMDGNGISYIGPTSPDSGAAHSYKAFGNNGTTFNRAINDPLNTAAPAEVLEALMRVSDHLPVIADYQLPAKMSVATASLAPRVILNADVGFEVAVTNTATVQNAFGADALDYALTATHTVEASINGSVRATQGAAVGQFMLDTSVAGDHTVQLGVTSSSQAVVNGSYAQSLPVTVLNPAAPSLDASSLVVGGTLDLGIVALGTTLEAGVNVYNLAGAFTASLDLDAAALVGDDTFATAFTPLTNIAAGDGRTIALSFSPTLSRADSTILTLQTSDEDLPGASARASLEVQVLARGALAGDANLSDTVDFTDLLILAQNYSSSAGTWFLGDFDRDGLVSFSDLLALAQNYGVNAPTVNAANFAADWELARSLVPEPASLALFAGGITLVRRRRA